MQCPQTGQQSCIQFLYWREAIDKIRTIKLTVKRVASKIGFKYCIFFRYILKDLMAKHQQEYLLRHLQACLIYFINCKKIFQIQFQILMNLKLYIISQNNLKSLIKCNVRKFLCFYAITFIKNSLLICQSKVDYYIGYLLHMSISKFAQNINLPICSYLDNFAKLKTDSQKDKISFLSGDPTIYGEFNFRMPQQGYQIMKKHIMNQDNHGYTLSNGIVTLRQAVTKLYKSKFQVNQNSVFINHGVNMGLLTVLFAFTNPGDQILVPEIGYPFFTDLCPAIQVKAIPYKLIKQKNFEIDLVHAQSLITEKTKFMFVINPSNPMGSIFSQNHMTQILNFCDKNQMPLVADEVYLRQSFSGIQHKSFGEVTSDVPVICLCGVQKIFSVPGWCNSWIIVFDRHNYLDQILKNISVLCTIFLHTNLFTQKAICQIIQTIGIFTHQKMPLIQEKHDLIVDLCKGIKCLKPIKAQGTIYISLELDFTNLQFSTDKQFCELLFKEENVSILPLSVFGSQNSNFQGLRVLTCAQQSYYQQFFKRLSEFAQKHSKK